MSNLFFGALRGYFLRELRVKERPRLVFLIRFVLLVSRIFSDAYLLLGKQKNCGLNLRVLIVGDPRTVSYLSSLLYRRQPHKIKLGKVFIYGMNLRLAAILTKTDLLFVKTSLIGSRYWRKKGYFLIPEWVKFRLPILPSDAVRNYKDSLKDDLRRVKKYQYSFEINHSKEQFDLFYKMMYLPYISMRYRYAAHIQNYSDLKYFFSKGAILLVKYENKYVSGSILFPKYDGLLCRAVGVLGGDVQYIKAGALAGVYHFTSVWAKNKGYKWVDFGGSRPFLEDGSFRYKRKWNMEMEQQDGAVNQYALRIFSLKDNVRSFLINNPFIYRDGKKFNGVFFTGNGQPVDIKEATRLYRRYQTPGLKKISAVSFSGFSGQSREYAKADNLGGLELATVDLIKRFNLYAGN